MTEGLAPLPSCLNLATVDNPTTGHQIFLGQRFRRLDQIVPLQVGEGAAGHFLGVGLLIGAFLFDCAEWIRLTLRRGLAEWAQGGMDLVNVVAAFQPAVDSQES